MTYTPDSQLLTLPIEKIVRGIDEFNAAANERIDDPDEWERSHLLELDDLLRQLQGVRTKLVILKAGVR